jgi:Kae1-associated kinase Bud32
MTGDAWSGEEVIAQGAEAVLEVGSWMGRPAVLKLRRPKGYRHPELETSLRTQRIRAEARALREARTAGVRTPAVIDLDLKEGRLVLELIEGPTVRSVFDGLPDEARHRVAHGLGVAMGLLHSAGIVHGDPTTSNFILESLPDGGPVGLAVLDISLGGRAEGIEERGVDLRLLYEAFQSTHHMHQELFDVILEGYREAFPEGALEAIARMDAIAARGRYVAREARRERRAEGSKEGIG